MLRTNVSWIELVLRPSGDRNPLTASIVHASVMERANLGGEKMHAQVGVRGLYAIREASCGSSNPKYRHMNQLSGGGLWRTEAWCPTDRQKPGQIGKKATTF
jgi:hypothetical protein